MKNVASGSEVTVGRGPVRPRLEDQYGPHTGGDGDSEASVWRVDLEVFEGPPVRDEARPGHRGVLHDQQVDAVWPHPVEEGERPHDQFEVGLVEGVAVVRIVPGVRGVVGVEVARGDLLPGLAVLAEVGGQIEVVPQVPAVLDEQHELIANTASPTNHAIFSPPCNVFVFERFSSRPPKSPPTIASGTDVATEQVYELGRR